ncbi:class I SAM-dependent methyltransferase [Candidatus Rhabdochlamydia porcellionis]|uniref:Methyltransferase domain n=1 Tax=Candidatus Rhabdochlamydia porcellionis TaxID=225148 RepID=A0ABX8Z270_9BACT|nr:class I SAM-dependent methyltransferase [Candidatus Rhabdochlamydia porcellionis]QZA58136.1 Methyltransferase domain [Candidatus Rhabdochlamydia porcellionis]
MKKILYAAIMLLVSICPQRIIASENIEWISYQNQVLSHQEEILGWCSKTKAKRMMDLIYRVRPELCVEIGVFGGSSIYPTVSALKFLNHGKVIAIDPWNVFNCLEGYKPDSPKHQFWGRINQESVYLGFMQMLKNFALDSYCTVMRMPSLDGVHNFDDESIDILHIDGNHSENIALKDVQIYLPKVKKGGYIWFDDTDYPETHKAWKFLSLHCIKDENFSTKECFLFRKL